MPMAQFGEKVWFRKIGEGGVISFASRMTQGIYVGHHDRTGAVLCINKNGVLRGKSWTRQTLSHAWDATNWLFLCGTPWQMVALELKLTDTPVSKTTVSWVRIVIGITKYVTETSETISFESVEHRVFGKPVGLGHN